MPTHIFQPYTGVHIIGGNFCVRASQIYTKNFVLIYQLSSSGKLFRQLLLSRYLKIALVTTQCFTRVRKFGAGTQQLGDPTRVEENAFMSWVCTS